MDEENCITGLLTQCCCSSCYDPQDGGWSTSVSPGNGHGGQSSLAMRDTTDSAVEIKAGLCGADPITKQGKRIQMAQMLCVPLVPVIILIAQILLSLVDSAQNKSAIESVSGMMSTIDPVVSMLRAVREERTAVVQLASGTILVDQLPLTTLRNSTDRQLNKVRSVWTSVFVPTPSVANLSVSYNSYDDFAAELALARTAVSHITGSQGNVTLWDVIQSYSRITDFLVAGIYRSTEYSIISAIGQIYYASGNLSWNEYNEFVGRYALGSFYIDKTIYYSPSAASLLKSFWTFDICGTNVDSQTVIGGTTGITSTVGSVAQTTTGSSADGSETTSSVPQLPSYVTAIATMSRQVLLLPDKWLNLTASIAPFASPSAIVETWWLGNLTSFLDQLDLVTDQIRQLVDSQLASDASGAATNEAISIAILVLVIVLSPVVFLLIYRMTLKIQNYALGLSEKTKELRREKKRSDTLLYQMLPKSVALQLKMSKKVAAESYSSVTIYFSDIVGFTSLSARSTPMQVVEFLNNLYYFFDTTIDKYDVYKVETIGDAYMVASGLPQRNGRRHASEIASLSVDLREGLKTFKIPHLPEEQLKLRIGLHTGPVVAGVVGSKMPRYCLFGETVNMASKMESYGVPLKIHISCECRKYLVDLGGWDIVRRGIIELKGKGQIETYFLRGRVGERRESESSGSEIERQVPLLAGVRAAQQDLINLTAAAEHQQQTHSQQQQPPPNGAAQPASSPVVAVGEP